MHVRPSDNVSLGLQSSMSSCTECDIYVVIILQLFKTIFTQYLKPDFIDNYGIDVQ